jgi:hypothetical protein
MNAAASPPIVVTSSKGLLDPPSASINESRQGGSAAPRAMANQSGGFRRHS